MTSSHLVVPLAVWGQTAPTHCVSSILMTPDQHYLITGCYDGQICIWSVKDEHKMEPECMLYGHTTAITCLAMGSIHAGCTYIISSSDNGEMCLWDIEEGRSIESAKLSVTHTGIQAYQMLHSRDVRLFCNGYYPEIHVIHPLSLEVLFSLSSRIQPDWISAFCILRPVKREDDVVVAISNSGTVKVWTLSGNENKSSQPIYEDEAKQIRCLNAQTLKCCAYNQRTVLIVCSKYWQIYDTNFVERTKPAGDEDGITWVDRLRWFLNISGIKARTQLKVHRLHANFTLVGLADRLHDGLAVVQSGGQSTMTCTEPATAGFIYDAGDFSLLCSESNRPNERWVGGDFIGVDRVVVWSNEGRGYLYKLPTNANPESEGYRRHSTDPSSPRQMGPQAYTVLDMYTEKPLVCCPAMSYFFGRRERECRLVLRGDSEGRIVIWSIPNIHDSKMKLVRQESFEKLPVVQPISETTLQKAWQEVNPKPEGLIDHLNYVDGRLLHITSTIFVPSQCRLVCGREDGSIVCVPAIEALTSLLLETGNQKSAVHHQVLRGHNGRVNCLLYPYNDDVRYDASHLLSGGMDFTVCLWDISTGSKLHTFSVHGGEITQLLVPPPSCNPRILPCVASIGSDHSLALLSLKERKCIMLASRQLFPIQTVKWRPLDDFLVIGCTDGTVYVWQMETGHLDRVVHGTTAEEILAACDEKQSASSDLTDPTISLAQAFKRHNLATFRNFAQQRIDKVTQHTQETGPTPHASLLQRSQTHPLLIQGLKSNPRDPDSHCIFFDTEAMIIQLLSEEYALMSPGTLEAHGLTSGTPTHQNPSSASDPQKKIAAFMGKLKDKAEDVGHKLQAKVEEAGFKPLSPRMQRRQNERTDKGARPKHVQMKQKSLTMQTAQFLISCLHAWGHDPKLDEMCLKKLGLMRPKLPLAFGLLSRGGHMSLLMPGWHKKHQPTPEIPVTAGHWEISSAVSTQHLLSMISVANTLMSMTNATFEDEIRAAIRRASEDEGGEVDAETQQQSQMKQVWSLIAAHHCVLLPDLIGINNYITPQLEMLARRWQDRCLEIREAAQALLLAELRRIGSEGRKKVVDDWAPYLPSYVDPALSLLAEQQGVQSQHGIEEEEPNLEDDDPILGDFPEYRVSQSFESRRKQATAIVMMGVLGAEFGQEMEPSRRKSIQEKGNKNVVEGFGLTDYSHARHTSKALTFLLLQPPSPKLPAYSPIRRAAIDLLGRGFTVWEPYLDVSAVLLGLLELCVDGDRLVPSMTFGLPLTPQADACRTSRHAVSLIATARPPAFIITMAKEVARYNAMVQNAQTPHAQLHNSVLVRGKSEILRILELLVDKIPNDVADLLVEVMDITVHCLDQAAVKSRGLQEVFPAICRFSMVSYCSGTRRICVGAKNGGLAFYELKQSKCQVLPAHKGAVTAVAFSPDGKYLASFAASDKKLLFWQTASTSLFGIGSQQTKCIRIYPTSPINVSPNTNPLKLARLIWIDARTVVLLTVDGTESKFKV